MTHKTSRRGFLTAAAAVGGAAVTVICSGSTFAAGSELPVVTYPEHPGAIYPKGASARTLTAGAATEPLNATVDCGLGKGGGA
ncbi:hypothetical protein GCM10009716_04340 [Streptomyces sodiiphilus]|uniref:Twin-arginine translocation signal domain-containing protein n=1 Tax=Streptomyces sodiiphilus TaxID=226217 RepID=A0ABN2NS80_9ACTN